MNTIDTVAYPGSFPFDSLKSVITILKGDDVIAHKAELAKHIWLIQGYAQSQLLGDPSGLSVIGALAAEPPGDPLLTVLENVAAAHEASYSAELPTKSSLPLPLEFLLQWALKELLSLLAEELGTPTL